MESILNSQLGMIFRRLASVRLPGLHLDNAEQLWARADVALMENDVKSAHEIYRRLSRRKPNTAYEFLFVGLSAYRLQDVARAMDVLEEGQRRYPSVTLLVENFLRIGLEQGQIDRTLRSIDLRAGKVACERLISQSANWNTQINLVVYCVRAGWWEIASARINEIIRTCNDTAAIWKLSDILLSLGRMNDAERIYQKLSARVADTAETALYGALSFERLRAPEKAVERLEAELSKHPNAHHLREHLLRICLATGQIKRVARLVDGRGGTPEALEALFERFPDRAHQLQLFEHCIDQGQISLVKAQLSRKPDGGRYDSGVLWNIAQRLDDKGYASDVREVFDTLLNRPRMGALDTYYAAASALRLGDNDLSLVVLEEGLGSYPTTGELRNLYLQLCAARLDYERYSNFMRSIGVDTHGAGSISQFYKAAVHANAPESFILNYVELRRKCPPDVFAALKNNVLEALKETKLPNAKAKLLAFFTRYLDLDDEFASALWKLLRGQSNEVVEPGRAPKKEQRALEMLFRLTPPMIPAERDRAEVQVRNFIEASRSLARRPIELAEPIEDMSNNWTPWQYLFCSGAIHAYSTAIAALEDIVFKTWPKLNYVAGHTCAGARKPGPGKRIRIGFIVHDSMPMMSGLLSGLNPSIFETVFLRPGKMGQSRAAKNWILRAERTVEFSDNNTYSAIDTIAAEQLDIIVCGPSVAAIFFPMMARLARLQMVLLEPNWTDGLTNADYYISWKPAEPENSGDFYKTKVALLKHPPYYIERHQVEGISDDARAELRRRLLDRSATDRIYLCANTPPKIHPDMDEMFRRLLEADPEGTLVILRGEYPPTKTLKSRLQQKLGKLADRIVFLPTLKQEDAHRLLLSVDCCLDSFPLCGMSSSFDAAMLGVPTVTLPSLIPFGKWTATIYDYIGASGLTAKDQDEYLQIAIRLANDPLWRNDLAVELREKAKLYIESAASVSEFAKFITKAWERHLEGIPPANWIDDKWQMQTSSTGSGESASQRSGVKAAAPPQSSIIGGAADHATTTMAAD